MIKLSQITPSNIKGFVQGHLRYYLFKWGWKSNYILEQFYYRITLMDKTCLTNKKCPCNCSCLSKQIEFRKCEKSCYDDMLDKKEWDELKRNKNLDIKQISNQAKKILKQYNYDFRTETEIIRENEVE